LRDEAAKMKRQGLDPAAERKAQAARRLAELENSFEIVSRAWHAKKIATWSPKQAQRVLSSLERNVFPATSSKDRWTGRFGALPITDIDAPMVLELLETIEKRGALEIAHRVRQRMSDVFLWAIFAGIAKSDPAGLLKKALEPLVKRKQPAFVKIDRARSVLAITEAAPAHPLTKLASRLLAITAVRTGSLRHAAPAEFEDLDTDVPIWRIPAAHMKLDQEEKEEEAFEFLVPLPRQAVDVVNTVLRLVGRNAPLLFPSVRHHHKPMSENAISTMYRRFPELQGRHVPHGWRSSFSTIMNERAIDNDRPADRAIIDLMLAHQPQGVESRYNRAAYMGRRRQIAQEWADLLCNDLRPAAELIEGPRKRS
jgi:integrase